MFSRRVPLALLLLATAATPAFCDTAQQRSGAFALEGGEAVYRGVCQGCHMTDAKGAEGAGRYPALAGNARLASAGYVIHIVLNGQKGMPALGGNFTDQQVADVVNYVRSHFGNSYGGTVTPADVQSARSQVAQGAVSEAPQREAPGQFALQAESPKFWDLVDKNASLEKAAGGFGFTEGPVWDEKGGFLYVSDEDQNRVARVYPDGRVETVLRTGDPDGATFDQRHRLIETASVLRAMIRVAPDGKYEVLADRYDGKKLNSPNDVVLGPDGALYFTDPTLDLVKGEKQELPYQGIFRMEDTGALKLLATDMSVPNGIAFSPDGKRLYVNDTRAREIRVYDFIHGEMKNGRLFAKEGPGRGAPDGMKVDVKGNVWVTGPGGVWVFDPRGNHLGTINLVEHPANFAWGDAGFSTLYFCGLTSIYKLKMKVKGFVPYVAYAK
jgi:gluconolactonase